MDALADSRTVPLVVDLDGTLIASDLLWEGLFILLRKQPVALLLLPFWLLKGPAALKREIAKRISIDPAALPYRPEVLALIEEAKLLGRPVVLATGSPTKFADAIGSHLGLFDVVLSTGEGANFTSRNKCRALTETYGDAGFDYLGNSRHDLCLFDAARRAFVVAPDRSAARWHRMNGGQLVATPRPTFKTVLKMLRVHQWLKNALIVVPLALNHEWFNYPMIFSCLVAFVAFSAAASAVYILNDFFDLALDRRHPTKRKRPFASGVLPIPFGLAAIGILLTVSGLCALVLPIEFAGVLAAYLVATTAYSLSVKRMLLLDVLMLAGLYTVRILAGAAATRVEVSFWLLAFSIFFFLSLALVKRFVELRSSTLVPGERIAGRGYRAEDQEIVAQAGMASAFSSALVLALYIDSDKVRDLYAYPWMVWPLAPIVLYLTMRVWILARRDEMHDDPVVFILRDWRSQVAAATGALLLVLAGA